MANSGQNTALELFLKGLPESRTALDEGKPPASQFLGAFGELIAASHMGAELVSGPEDRWDAEVEGSRIEIKSTMKGSVFKPKLASKEFDQLCKAVFSIDDGELWIESVAVRNKGQAGSQAVDLLTKRQRVL